MGKSSASTPDYVGQAEATSAGNLQLAREQTSANRVNTYSPYGSVTYGESSPNVWQEAVTLSPEQQEILNNQNATNIKTSGIASNYADQVGGALASSQPNLADGWNTAYNSIVQRNQPQQAIQLKQLQTQLATQGIVQGSDAYNNAMYQFGRQVNDFNLAAQTQANSQQTQSAQLLSGEINNLNALRSGTAITSPDSNATGQQSLTSGTDYTSAGIAAGNAAQAKAQSANAATSTEASAGAGLAAAAILALA